MHINLDTLAAIAQERHKDFMREAAVLHLLRKERTAQSQPRRFLEFVMQLWAKTRLQTSQAPACETLS